MGAGVVALAVLVCLGCTGVQKGAAVGGGAGGATGATLGYYTSFGGAKGGLLGLGVGTVAGVLAADSFYPSDEEELVKANQAVEELNDQLADSEAKTQEVIVALDDERAQRQALLEAHEKLRQELQGAVPAGSSPSGSEVDVAEQPDGGVKITLLSEVMFASGKTQLLPGGKAALSKAAATIKRQWPNATIEIRGHTDNVPIKYSKYRSNWELSCARSLAVLHHLEDTEHFPPDRLMVVGCGDTQPVAPNTTAAGRRKNRRAELIVRPASVQIAARD